MTNSTIWCYNIFECTILFIFVQLLNSHFAEDSLSYSDRNERKNKMNWVNKYKNKAKRMKLIGLFIFIFTILAEVKLISYTLDVNEPWPLLIFMGIAFWGIYFSVLFLLCKVVYRKYNNNYICFYVAPIKNYLVINNEVQYEGGPFTHYYYGQLRDGTDITVKLGYFGEVKFAIGYFNNFNLSFF